MSSDDWEIRELMDDTTGRTYFRVYRFGNSYSRRYTWLWRARLAKRRMKRNWERLPYGGRVIR